MDYSNLLLPALVIILVIGWLLYRQMYPRRLSTRSLILVPLIIGFLLVQSASSFQFTTAALEEIAITSIASIVLGLLACRELRVYPNPDGGRAMVVGSWTYFLWWLAAFVIKAALAYLFGETSFASTQEFELLLPVFLLMVARNGYLYWKATQMNLALH